MDPITPIATLALVCNITQLIAQAVDAVRCCKELWDQGSLDKHNIVERCTVQVVEANSALDLAIKSQPVAGRAAKIRTLAEDAVDTAKQLKVELNKLKLSKAQGVRTGENFKRALRTFIKGGTIPRLEEKLERQERTLKSSLLKDLYIKCGQSDLVRRDEFQKLSQGQQDIVTQVLHAQNLLSADLVASITSSEANITSHLNQQDIQLARSLQLLLTEVPNAVQQSQANVIRRLDAQGAHLELKVAAQQAASAQWRHQEKQDVLRQRLLDALAFPEMNERRNMIERRVGDFGSTYAWIFGCSEDYSSDSETDGEVESDADALFHGSDSDDPETTDDNKTAKANHAEDEVLSAGTVLSATNSSTVDDSDARVLRINRDGKDDAAHGRLDSTEDGTLFNKSSDTAYLDFLQWLQSDDDVFWISGKPGSGKSTLMDFVFHNLQKGGDGFDALQAWAGMTEVRLLSFWFFRPATSVLLKTMQGFWRSLCFQILNVDKTVLETTRRDDDGTAPESLRSCVLVDDSCARTWTDSELKAWLQYLLAHSSFKYCILVDGLDEIESGPEQLLKTCIFLTSAFQNVKLLCSSREERPFDAALGSYPLLRVQDFNYRDISLACEERLRGTRAADLAYDVVDRAEGVFLWAHMIAEDLRAAAGRGDDEEELKQRLNACPSEMSDLFKHLLQRQDIFYTKNPKPYLQLVKFASTELTVQPTLLEVLVASQDQKELDSVLSTQRWDQYASILNDRAVNFETSLLARCTGLVEIAPSSRSLLRYFNYANLGVLDRLTPRFIHRSVLDFLHDSPVASSMSLLSTLSEEDVAARLFDAACIGLFVNVREVHLRLDLAMVMACAQHLTSSTCDFKTAERLDAIFTELSTRAEPARITPGEIPFLGSNQFRVTAPELSLLDNLTYAMAAVHALYPYIHGKTCNLDPDRRPIALSVFHCNVLHMPRLAFDEAGWSGAIVDRTLNTMQIIRLEYGAHESEIASPTIVSSGYVWEHLAVACAAAAVGFERGLDYDHLPERLSLLCQSLQAVEDDQERYVEGFLFGKPGDYSTTRLAPMPDEWSQEQLQSWPQQTIIFQIRLVLRVLRPDHEHQYAVLQFSRLRIAGTARFLDLSRSQSRELEQLWSVKGHAANIISWYHRNMAEIWNQCLTWVSALETVELLKCHMKSRSIIFRDGKLQQADPAEWRAWEQELESNRLAETDPVLLGYLEYMQEKQRERDKR